MTRMPSFRSVAWLLVLGGLTALMVSSALVQESVAATERHQHTVQKAPWAAPKSWSGPQARPAQDVEMAQVAGAAAEEVDPIDLKVLVISADGSEAVLPAIKQTLDFLGTPYTVYIAQQTPGGLTQDKLYQGVHAYYQAVILTTGDLPTFDGTQWKSALTDTEWQTLWSFEALFGIRQVNWYAFPTPTLGWSGTVTARDTGSSPLAATFTLAGGEVFPYVNRAGPLTIRDAYCYLAPAASDGMTQTLLADESGNALSVIRTFPDGRLVLSQSFDTNQHLRHHQVLGYGLVRWATKGLFLGERHAYLGAQVDDIFLYTDLWPGHATYRMSGADLQAVVNWQTALRQRPVMAGFALDMAFNGEGTTSGWTHPDPDTLTPVARQRQAQFKWISHTWDHENMDAMNATDARTECTRNNNAARNLGLAAYDKRSIVTPQISGLSNPQAMQGIFDAGVRFLVSDTSRPGQNNPSPNAGLFNAHQPGILMIPRKPTNLFYNVSTPAEWAGEYNQLYRSFWGRDLTYEEILHQESEMMVGYLLKGDVDPLMFHQANLRAYDGQHTLLGDLIDRTLAKYESHVAVPIVSPTMDRLADLVLRRMTYNASGVTAQIVPPMNGNPGSITLVAPRACTVPVTGLRVPASKTTSSEVYAGENISYIKLSAGTPVTYPLN